MLGRHLVKSWSSTQTPISLSSGEVGFYAVVNVAGVGLGLQSLLQDLHLEVSVRVWTDSTASIGICRRQDLGKLRHIDTQCLWIQQRIRDKTIELRKVRGEVGPADLFTKHLTGADRVESLLGLFGCYFSEGRAASAPALRTGAGHESRALLALDSQQGHVDTMEHDGRRYPKSDFEGVRVTETYEHDVCIFPHAHVDFEARFRRRWPPNIRRIRTWTKETWWSKGVWLSG